MTKLQANFRNNMSVNEFQKNIPEFGPMRLVECGLKENPEISVIVPIYNTEEYLQTCLNSIAEQTFCNIEVLLVDDGSTDGSADICKQFIKKDSRFIYFFKKNEGQYSARNLGLEHARGRFVSFVDSDDYVHKNFLERMYKVVKEQEADIGVCRFLPWYPPYQIKHRELGQLGDILIEDAMTFQYGIFSLIHKPNIHQIIFGGHVANKFFRVEVLKNIRFKNWKVEDEIFLFELSRKVKKVVYLKDRLYYYRQRPLSSVKSVGFNRSILEERLYLLTKCNTNDEIICVKQAVLSQIYRCFLTYLYNYNEPIINLNFIQQQAKRVLSQSPFIITSPALTTTKLSIIKLLVRSPICFLNFAIFICRKVLFLPTLYNFFKNLKNSLF